MSRLLTIQRLRAIAAILVIGVHAGRLELRAFPATLLHPIQAFGNAGVDLFFTISGFIMIATTWDSFGRTGASWSFLIRRALRIYPLYWIVMAVYLALDRIAPAVLHIDDASAGSIVASLLLFPQQHEPILVVAWTLVCEVGFYAVFALLLLAPRRRNALVLLGLWAGAAVAAAVFGVDRSNPIVAQLLSPFNVEFALGVGVGYLVKTGRGVPANAALGIGLAGLAAAFVYLLPYDDVPSTWFRVLCFGLPFAFVVYGATRRELRAATARSKDWLTAIGDASYSMYLWHGFLLAAFTAVFVRLHAHGLAWHASYLVAMYGFVILASLALYRFVERPLIRFVHRRTQPAESAGFARARAVTHPAALP